MNSYKLKLPVFFSLGLLLITLAFACGESKKGALSNKSKENIVKPAIDEDHTAEAVLENELNSQEIDAPQLAKADDIISATTEEMLAEIDAPKLFKIHCALCHGFKGDANINGAKDLTKSHVSLSQSVAQVYHGKGLMRPFQGVLKDAEIVAVCKFTEGLSN